MSFISYTDIPPSPLNTLYRIKQKMSFISYTDIKQFTDNKINCCPLLFPHPVVPELSPDWLYTLDTPTSWACGGGVDLSSPSGWHGDTNHTPRSDPFSSHKQHSTAHLLPTKNK
jgi:hypothetical protein